MSNDRNELPDHEQAGRKACRQMEGDADSVDPSAVVVPLAGGSSLHKTTRSGSRYIEI